MSHPFRYLLLVTLLAALVTGCAPAATPTPLPTALPATRPAPTSVAGSGSVTLEVYDPSGATEVQYLHAARLDDLHGKTIGELSNGSWEADRTFPVIRAWLQEHYPDVKIVPYTEFPSGYGKIDVANIADLVKAKGVQALIVGNAG